MPKTQIPFSAPPLSGKPLAGTPLPQTGGSFTRQKDGSLKPPQESSKPGPEKPANATETGKD